MVFSLLHDSDHAEQSAELILVLHNKFSYFTTGSIMHDDCNDCGMLSLLLLTILHYVLVGKNLIFNQKLMREYLCTLIPLHAAAFSGGYFKQCMYYHLDMICCSHSHTSSSIII